MNTSIVRHTEPKVHKLHFSRTSSSVKLFTNAFSVGVTGGKMSSSSNVFEHRLCTVFMFSLPPPPHMVQQVSLMLHCADRSVGQQVTASGGQLLPRVSLSHMLGGVAVRGVVPLYVWSARIERVT